MLDGSNGTQVWLDTLKGPGFSGNNFSRLTKAVINAADEIFVTGRFTGAGSSGSGSFLMVAAKYNASGTRLWLQTFDHSTTSFPENSGTDISLDASGNVYVGGMTKLVTNGENFATWKINPSNGNLVLIATKPGPIDNVNTGAIRSIITDSNGNSYVYSISSGEKHRVVKYDSQGSEQWSYDFDTIGSGFPASFTGADNHLAFDNSGNIILASLFHQMDFTSKIGVAKFDQAGNLLWLTLISGTSNNHNEVYALVTDVNDNIYLTGTTSNPGFDIATIKLDPNGNEIWRVIKDGSASDNDKGHSIALGNDGSLYVGGLITNSTNGDYYVVKFQVQTATSVEDDAFEKNNILIFPNPTSDIINLHNLISGTIVTIYDINGRIVSNFQTTLPNETIDISDKRSGIYFLQLTIGKSIVNRRIIVQEKD